MLKTFTCWFNGWLVALAQTSKIWRSRSCYVWISVFFRFIWVSQLKKRDDAAQALLLEIGFGQ
jgi:hypothetical protein